MTFPLSFQTGGIGSRRVNIITGNYTVGSPDNNTIIGYNFGTASATVSLGSAAVLGIGFSCSIWNIVSAVQGVNRTVTITPSGSQTIDGVTTLILRGGEGTDIVSDGTNWQTGAKKTMRAYAENTNATSTRPIASGSGAIAIGVFSQSTTEGSIAIGGNATQSIGAKATGTSAIAIGARSGGTTASGSHSIAIGASSVTDCSATSASAVAIGCNSSGAGSQAITGAGAMALGGSYASGTDSFAAAVADNTSTYGARAANAIAIGQQATATVASAVAIGAQTQATGVGGYCVAIGYQSQATAAGAIAIGNQYNVAVTQATGSSSIAIGDGVVAQGQYSIALGAAAKSFEYGKFSRANGFFAAVGDNQIGGILLRIATTDATATVLTSNAGAASTTNQLILQNNQAMVVTGSVICRQSVAGADKASGWTFSAVIRRGANAGTTALVAAVTPVLVAQDVSLATTAVSVTADTTNGGLAVTVTGIAATNLRWVANINTAEVIYA
jgi:hypothetical protein